VSKTNPGSYLSSKISDSEELQRVITEHLPAQDEITFALGDTLDIKTSIILVVIVFFATQSGMFLALSVPRHWHNLQIISVSFLVVAGLLALLELWPVEYKTRMADEQFLGWVSEIKDFYSHQDVENPESKMIERIHTVDIQRTRERLVVNSRLNAWKGWAMRWSYYTMMVAVVLNLATLLALSTGWRF
jgi:hypothetical protein